ncbi:hypothetical protein VTH06DRAFT_3062, partial [Thermothelomyces fergusii]
GSGADSRRGSPPASARQRISSVISSDSQYTTSSLAPSTSITSPEDSVFSPAESNSDRQRAIHRSPPVKLEPKDPSPALSARPASQRDDQGREQPSTHRQLPSLSDIFDGQSLPGTMRPPNDSAGGYRFSGAPMMGSPGPHQPAPLQPPPSRLAGQNDNPSLVRQTPSSDPVRQIVDGYHHRHHRHQSASALSHYPSTTTNEYQVSQPLDVRQQQQQQQREREQQQHQQHKHQQSPPGFAGIPPQGKHTSNLDGMSALLKAGELVERRTQ